MRPTRDWPKNRGLYPHDAPGGRPLRHAGLRTLDLTGVVYDPLRDRFRLSRDPAVNSMLFATRG